MSIFRRILMAVTILGLTACTSGTRQPEAPLPSALVRGTVQPTMTPTLAPTTTTAITSPLQKVESHSPLTSTLTIKLTATVSAQPSATVAPFPPKHNGSKIAFISMESGQADIWSIGSDGKNRTQLTNDDSIEWGLAWSPRGDTIAYSSRSVRSAMNSDALWILDTQDTSTRWPIGLGLDGISAPTWSPDGDTIAYSTWVTDVPHIWLVDLNTGSRAKVPSNRAAPLWSSGDKLLAVIGPSVEEELGIRSPLGFFSIIRTNGEPLDYKDWGWDWIKQVTGMAWSHTGDRLLVTSEAGVSLPNTASLEIVKVADNTASIVVNQALDCNGESCDFYSPMWSPHDEEILFIAAVPVPWDQLSNTPEPDEPESKWWIFKAAEDLGVIEPIFESVVPISDASLSPDGSQVVFVHGKDLDAELWVLDLDTGQTVQLTDNAVYDGGPVWQPYPGKGD